MKTLQQIIARKAELRTMLEEPKADLNAIEIELRELNEEQGQLEKRERLIKEAGEINKGNTGEVRENFIIGNKENLEERDDKYSSLEYRKAFMNYARTGVISNELRADATTMTTDLGAVIPTTVMNEIIQKLKSYGQIYSRIRKQLLKVGLKYQLHLLSQWQHGKLKELFQINKRKQLKPLLNLAIINYNAELQQA